MGDAWRIGRNVRLLLLDKPMSQAEQEIEDIKTYLRVKIDACPLQENPEADEEILKGMREALEIFLT